MNHLTEEQVIAYREGDHQDREQVASHLRECNECRKQLARIETVFSALNAVPAPDPGEDYEQRLWQQIAPRLTGKSPQWGEGLFAPRRLAVLATLAAVIVLAFLVGRVTKHPAPENNVADASKVRERVLVVAVGEHLGRSEMVLMELENAQPAQLGQKSVDISATQRRAEDLLEENRLYRQTALREGDRTMASTLDELERVLLDIANSPDTVSSAQFEFLRKRIEDQGILFKVRVVNQDLQQRSKPSNPIPTQKNSAATDRSKI
jgi:hypothetical protein